MNAAVKSFQNPIDFMSMLSYGQTVGNGSPLLRGVPKMQALPDYNDTDISAQYSTYAPEVPAGGGFWDSLTMKNLFGGKNADGSSVNGVAGTALGVAQGLGNMYMGMKQYGLAKDQLSESKRQYNQNFNIQKGLTNSQLEDRQRARIASNSGAYQSVGEYMKQNGVK